MYILWGIVIAVLLTILSDVVRGLLVRGIETVTLGAVRFLISLNDAPAAADLRAELLYAITLRIEEARKDRSDTLQHLGTLLREPNDLIADPIWRAGLRPWVPWVTRGCALALVPSMLLLAFGAGVGIAGDVGFGWASVLPIAQLILMIIWLVAGAVRLALPVGWGVARRVSGTAAWCSYLTATACLAIGCPRTSATEAMVETGLAALALFGVLRTARTGQRRHLLTAVPFLVIEGIRTAAIDGAACSTVPVEGALTILAAIVVLAASKRQQPSMAI